MTPELYAPTKVADIIGAIREIEGGTSQTEVARRMGVTML